MKFWSFFPFLLVKGGLSFLSPPEWDIVMGLIDLTYVKRVIVSPKDWEYHEATILMKELSKRNVQSAFIKRGDLRRYLESSEFKFLTWTLIVVKESDMKSVDYLNDWEIISSFFWVFFDASNGTLKQELENLYISLNTAFVYIEQPTPNHYILTDYFKIRKSAPGVHFPYGEWYNNQLNLTQLQWYERKNNFQGYELSTVKFKQDMYLTPKEAVSEAIWKELSLILNFTVKQKLIDYSPTNRTVDLDENEDEAFLDPALYIGNTQKYKYMLGPTSRSIMYMHVKTEGEYRRFTRFLMPFTKQTWSLIAVWICGCGFLAFVIEYLSRKYIRRDKPRGGLYMMAFIPLDSICNQCGHEISSNYSSRTVLFIIRTTACVICYSYAATLISYILLHIPLLPFVDLEGLVNDGRYKIIAERNSDVDAYFNVSAIPLERLVYEKYLVDVREWDRLDKEVDRLCRGEKLVLIAFDDDIEKYAPCHIVKIRKPLKVLKTGFKLKFMSPFRGVLHAKLLLIRSSGILHKWNRSILPKNKRRWDTNHSDDQYKVGMQRISSAFTLLAGGQILALIILAIEIRMKKRAIPAYRRQYLE